MNGIYKKDRQRNTSRAVIMTVNDRTGISGNACEIKSYFYRGQIASVTARPVSGRPYTRGCGKGCQAMISAIGADGLIDYTIAIVPAGSTIYMFTDADRSVVLPIKSCI